MGLFDRVQRAIAGTYDQVDNRQSPTSSKSLGDIGFAVIDFETTGLSPTVDRIVQAAVVLTDDQGNVLDRWSTLVNPDGPMGGTHVHGITSEDVRAAPRFGDIVNDLGKLLGGRALVAHNMRFDSAFLSEELRRLGWELPQLPQLCTYVESSHFLPELDQRRLPDCCAAVGIQFQHHDAMQDATACSYLLKHYLGVAARTGVRKEILTYPVKASAIAWPATPTRDPLDPTESQRRTRIAVARAEKKPAAAGLSASAAQLPVDAVLWDEAPAGVLEYLELLRTAIEDSVLSPEEERSLAELAQRFGLDDRVVLEAKQRLMCLLAAQAWSDGHVSREEQRELKDLLITVGLPEKDSIRLLKQAEALRDQSLSADLAPLPADWNMGEPLRVGHRVAFSGCDWEQRLRLEEQCVRRGCRLSGSVSGKTDWLVTDGGFEGTKVEAARKLGTRVIHPSDFELLLTHIQPAV